MTNLNHPSSPRTVTPAPAASVRGSVKGALALLALLLLGLLLWQLFSQFRHTQAEQRQQHLDASVELADHLALNMALKAQQALNVVQPYVKAPAPAALPSLLDTLRERLPSLRDLAWLDHSGRLQSDSLAGSPDRPLIDELFGLNQGRPYFFANSADNRTVYLLLRQATEQGRGYWLLRLSNDFYRTLTLHLDGPGHPLWLLENSRSGEVLERHAPAQTSDQPLQSVMLVFIDNSVWQLRGLFDAGLAQQKLLPALLGKCLLALFCALLPVLALINMRRRQRALQEDRRRYQEIFEGTGVALCVL
ncbi:diguanylate phosphodiesterase, partial [Pseudomonas putida]